MSAPRPRPRVLRVDADDPDGPDAGAIREAAAVLRAGGLVAFPTETVYGLGADACNAGAVAGIFTAKGRPADNPLIVHVANTDGLAGVAATVSPLAARLAERWWPGPLTIIVDADSRVPPITTGGLPTVGVRVPAHPTALALLEAAAIPVAAPSANRSGRPSPTTAEHVLEDLAGRVDVLVDAGPCRVGVESTVVDARGDHPAVLREGAITREDLGIDGAGMPPRPSQLAASPGTRYRHYAPACRVEIAPAGTGADRARALVRAGVRVGLVGTSAAPRGALPLARFSSASELANVFYDALRRAELAGVDTVVVEAVDERGIGRAVMDRLRRAAAG